jgi:simple sugar transport system permease protein
MAAETVDREEGSGTARLRGSAARGYLHRFGSLTVLVLLMAVVTALKPQFLTLSNFSDMGISMSITFLITLGVTFSLIVNGFDLSIGSVASLSSVVAAGIMVLNRGDLLAAILIPLAIGGLVGLLNAILIVRFRMPDLIVTLGMMFAIQGVQETYSGGANIYPQMFLSNGKMAPGTFLPGFVWIVNGTLLGVPVPIWIMFAVGVAAFLLLERTRIGRYFYATGDNYAAAQISGVPVERYKGAAYVISGLLSAAGGILLTSLLGSGENLVGSPYLLDTVTAAFLGFSVLGYNKANVFGSFIGTLFLATLLTGLTMLNVPYTAQDIFKGIVLLGAIAFTYMAKAQSA